MQINQVYQGDCIEIMKTFPDNSVDLVFTDPPYNFEVVGGSFKSENPSTSRDYLSKIIDNGYGNFDPKEFLQECKRVLKKIRMIVFCNRFLLEKYIEFARENKLIFDVHIMGKNNPAPFKINTYLSDIEYIIVMRENGTFFNKKSKFDDYRKITMVNVNSRNSHPAQKPIEVIEKYLRVLCDRGELVLDPFLGSGTTALACKGMGINWIGIEHNEEYVDICNKRLAQQTLNFKEVKQDGTD